MNKRVPDVLRGLLSVIDQGVFSLGNFVTVILLSRALSPDAFGSYALIFNALLLFASVQQALVTGPTRVVGASRVWDERYVNAQLRLQGVVVLAQIPLLACVLVWFVSDAVVLLGALFAMTTLQLHEFVRSVNVTRLSLTRLLLLDTLTQGLRIGALGALFALDELTLWNALAVISASALVALPLLRWRTAPAGVMAATFAENWRLGRWLLLDAIAFTLSTRAYVYLAAIWLGLADVAGLGAGQNLVGAGNVIIGGLLVVAIPAARLKLAQDGYAAWRSSWLGAGALIALLGAVLFGTIAVFAKELMSALYPAYYVAFAPLVVILAIGAWIDALNNVVVAALWTAERPQSNVIGKALSVVFVAGWAYPGVHGLGITGAAIGLAAAPAIWLLVNVAFLLKGSLSEQRMVTLAGSVRSEAGRA